MMRSVSSATPTMMRSDVPPKNDAIAQGRRIRVQKVAGNRIVVAELDRN